MRRLALTLAAAMALAPAATASAAEIEVDTAVDVLGTDCSLRAAIQAANTDAPASDCPTGSGTDTITFDPSVFPPSGDTTIDLTGLDAQLNPTTDMTIQGPGPEALEVTNTNSADRIFSVGGDGFIEVTISGMTISGGDLNGQGALNGAGILNQGDSTLSLEQVVVRQNSIEASEPTGIGNEVIARGAGIATIGQLTIEDSEISDNTAFAENTTASALDVGARGGGIYHSFSFPLEVTGSVIQNNDAIADDDGSTSLGEASGGGIYSEGDAVVTATSVIGNGLLSDSTAGTSAAQGGGLRMLGGDDSLLELSTVSGNTVTATGGSFVIARGGGVLGIQFDLSVVSSTIAENGRLVASNPADMIGANLTTLGAEMNVLNTIVTAPIAATPGGSANCDGTFNSGGFNVDYDGEDGSDCGFDESTDHTADPDLGTLQDNGGFGETYLPNIGSPVIDKGDAGAQTGGTDQRGFVRPLEFSTIANASGGDGSDIGSVEVQATPSFTGSTPASPNDEDTPLVQGTVEADPGGGGVTVDIFSDAACTTQVGGSSPQSTFEGPGILVDPLPLGTTTLRATIETDYGTSACSSGAFPNTLDYTRPQPSVPPTPTPPQPPAKKKCKKGQKLKKGKCVKKKRKKKRKR